VPWQDVFRLNSVSLCQTFVSLSLEILEWPARQLFQLVEQPDSFLLVLLAQLHRHRVVVVEPQRLGSVIAEFNECEQVRFDNGANFLGCFPRLAPERRISADFQDIEDIVTRDGRTVDLRSVNIELVLNLTT
jgi:hypothetical protein